MAGQVQCIYIDPPYGIKYGSNWQMKLNNRNVKDGSDDHLTGEPEQIKAFRDTWEYGIHSYLSYMRDRLLVAKELLNDSGSCFVQISDENVHLVRCLMDEVFGSENFVRLITVKKTAGLGTDILPSVCDYIVWYAKSGDNLKYRSLFKEKELEGDAAYTLVELESGERRRMTKEERVSHSFLPSNARIYRHQILLSAGRTESCIFPIEYDGQTFNPTAGRSWATNVNGIKKLINVSYSISF